MNNIVINKLYDVSKDKTRFITYNIWQNNKKNTVYIIFLHGLMSNMQGKKALYLEQYCQQKKYNFIKFDNFAHGQSSGIFLKETISSWFKGLELVINELTEEHKLILIGSSMGGWLSLLAGLKFPNKILGQICIAPAPDFTEKLIWQKLPPPLQDQLKRQGWLEIKGSNCHSKYPISYKLIEDARSYLLLDKTSLDLAQPVHLIHGMLDVDVPADISMQLFQMIKNPNAVLKLIKDGDHRMSRNSDLLIISNSLEEILAASNLP